MSEGFNQSRVFYFLVKGLFKGALSLYFKVRVRGLEGRELPSPLIVASNHCSHLDPPFIGAFFPGQLCYLAKEELFHNPLMGLALRGLGALPVDRDDQRGSSGPLRLMLKLLKEGRRVLIFPEGTRSPDGRLQPLEEGVAFLSLKARAPVLPVFIRGTFEAFPKGASFPRPGRVSLSFGDLIWPQGFLQDGAPEREARSHMLKAIGDSLMVLSEGHD